MIYCETPRLILRDWREEDLPMFKAMNQDPKVMRYFPGLLSDEQSEQFLDRIRDEFQHKGWGLYAAELKSTGEFIGYIGLHEIGFEASFTPGVEIGWRLAADCHNRGYATEGAKAVLDLAGKLGLERLYSFTAVINVPSQRVMQKIGMTKCGEFAHPNLDEDSPLSLHVLYKIDL